MDVRFGKTVRRPSTWEKPSRMQACLHSDRFTPSNRKAQLSWKKKCLFWAFSVNNWGRPISLKLPRILLTDSLSASVLFIHIIIACYINIISLLFIHIIHKTVKIFVICKYVYYSYAYSFLKFYFLNFITMSLFVFVCVHWKLQYQHKFLAMKLFLILILYRLFGTKSM